MKIFRIDNMRFEPFTILAPDNASAADMFVGRIACGIGNTFDATYTVTEWRPRHDEHPSLIELGHSDGTGFAWSTPDGWKIFPPMWELKPWV